MSDDKPKTDEPGSSSGWLYGVGIACIVGGVSFLHDALVALRTHTTIDLPGSTGISYGPVGGVCLAVAAFVIGFFGLWAGHDKRKEERARDGK